MKFRSCFGPAARLASLSLAVACLFAQGSARAQQLLIDFRFDDNPGTVAGSTTAILIPNSQVQIYTIDVWATVVPATSTPPADLGLRSVILRGASDSIAPTGAFATGPSIGVVPGSFVALAPFDSSNFVQPGVGDIGSTTNNGTSITSTIQDGISDFGGTTISQFLKIISKNNQFMLGSSSGLSGASGGWEWEIAKFQFRTGTASSPVGATTFFVPTQVSGGSTSSAGVITTDGTNPLNVPITIGSSLKFVVVSGVPEPSTTVLAMLAGLTLGIGIILRRRR